MIFHQLALIRLRFRMARENLRRAEDLSSVFPLLTGLLYLGMGLFAVRQEMRAVHRRLPHRKKHGKTL